MSTPSATDPQVEVLPDATRLAAHVARRRLERLVGAQVDEEVPQIVLTGGSIADAIHHEVARLAPEYPVDWSRVEVWWGDERFVSPDSPDRNAGQARLALLDPLRVPPGRVHEIPATDQALDVDAAASAYSAQLRTCGPGEFDLVMLGVGPDGHVASLFPGHPAAEVADELATGVRDSPKPPPERVSLTFATLNRSRAVWFLVAGPEKAQAVALALAGEVALPAARVQGRLETRWLVDESAAGLTQL
ncbi:MAG: 6-phosphogluconolactonase [Nocardioides sp.]